MNTISKLRISIILLPLLSAPHAKALTFDEALKQSGENSHELKELKLQLDSARWNVDRAYAGFLPKVDLKGQHLFAEKFTELELEFGGANVVIPAIAPYTSLGVSASINLYNGLQTAHAVDAARLQNEAARFRYKRAEELQRAEIRTLFYKALGSKILLDVAVQNIATLETHLHDVSNRIKSGVSTRYDSLRVEVQLEEAKTDKVAAESTMAVTRSKLFEALGLPDDDKPLLGKLPDDLEQIKLSDLTAANVARTDRSALIATRDQSAKDLLAVKGQWMPKVSLFGDYEVYNNYNHAIVGPDEHFKGSYAIGVQVGWNLYDGGSTVAIQNQAIIATQIAEEKIKEFDNSAPAALEEAKRRFSYDLINYKAKLSSIRKAQEAVRLAQGGAKAGTRTNTEVLDAVVDLNRAKASAVKSQIDAIEALGQLELSVGHGLI